MFIDNFEVQRALKTKGLYAGVVDGKFFDKSKAAARALANAQAPKYDASWPDDRVRIAVEQVILRDVGFYTSAIDGIAGSGTQAAAMRWRDHITFDRDSPNPSAGVPKATVWPRQKDCISFYGIPGQTTKIVSLETPYPLYLDWEPTKKVEHISLHEKCAPSAGRAMAAILAHYGIDRIHELGIDQFGGSLNVRKMRNGTSWSMHAFGCAIDFDADRNSLHENHTTARFAKPEYVPFFEAWEAEGWISLGRARDFDWMHVQAARL